MKVLIGVSSSFLAHFVNCLSIGTYSFPSKSSPLECAYHSPILVRASSSSLSVPEDDKVIMERKKCIAGVNQNQLLEPHHLADTDSRFCEFGGVTIHHKMCDSQAESLAVATSATGMSLPEMSFPFVLLHGFGASVFSWNSVMKPLSKLTSSKVLAFDRPAFGLTSRLDWRPNSASLNPYSMKFSVLATQHFIDSLTADRAVLVGHSAGGLVAVNAYFEAPERVAALILVSPAILAPRNVQRVVIGGCADYVASASVEMMKEITNFVCIIFRISMVAFLDSALSVILVRFAFDKFGIAAIKCSWYDANQVTPDVISGYTKPLRAKGWDKGLTHFLSAMISYTGSKGKPSIRERLHEIACPVLIITGDNDRLVPLWNSKRLSEAIPGCSFQVFNQCGHLPQEEKAEEFIVTVDNFLRRSLSNSTSLT